MMKISKLIPILIVALPLLASADGPATAPGNFDQPMFPRFGLRPIGGRAEWDDMIDFMNQYSPNRARILNRDDLWENNIRARNAILKKWRDYKFVSEHFPEVAKLRVQRFQIEDQIFGLELQARRDPTILNTLRPQIHEKAAQLVSLSIQERQLRIAKMEKLIASEKQKLSEDQSQQDALIDQRTDRIMDRLSGNVPTTAPSTSNP
jgi:hypothetical protein